MCAIEGADPDPARGTVPASLQRSLGRTTPLLDSREKQYHSFQSWSEITVGATLIDLKNYKIKSSGLAISPVNATISK